MLGFEHEHSDIKGKFAKRLHETLYRIATGKYNRNDILSAAVQHEKFNVEITPEDESKIPYEDLLAKQINDATSKYIVFVNPTITFDYKTTYKGLKLKLIGGYLQANYKFRYDDNYKTQYTFVICGTDKDKILNDSIKFFKKQYADFEKQKKLVYIKLTEVNIHDDYTSVSYQMYTESD